MYKQFYQQYMPQQIVYTDLFSRMYVILIQSEMV